jgi:hypothetical protein
MKKFFLLSSVILILISAYVYFSSSLEVEGDVVKIQPIPKSIDKQLRVVKKIEANEEKSAKPKDQLVDNVEFAKYIDRVESDWNKSIEDLFLEDPETGNKYIGEYKKLKNGYEVEREKRYEVFHRIMEEKHGANYSYSPTVDEEMFNEKLVKAYEKSLFEIIGEEKMRKYISVKDNFNRKLEDSSKNSKQGDSFLLIEF